MQASFKLALTALLLCLTSCVAYAPQPVKSQLEMRELQSRTYARQDANSLKILKAVLNVLQDEGFIVRNADKDLGFVMASKEVDVQDPWRTTFSVLLQGDQARYQTNSVIECSVHVTELGPEVKIRAVFQQKVIDNRGGTVYVQQIESAEFYRDFFAKVDKGIYLERQNF